MRLTIALLVCLGCSVHAEPLFGQDVVSDFHFDSSDHATVPTTNGVVFEAMINGKGPFQLIFDSGASVNILNPAVIARLGLPVQSGSEVVPAIGGAVEAKAFHADEVRIGSLALHEQTFYSIQMPWPDGTGPVGAVGYEVMRQLVVTVDYAQQRLTFFDPVAFVYRGRGGKVALEPDRTQVVVDAGIGGRARGDFVIDTGDFGGLSVSQWFVKKFAVLDHVAHRYHGVFGGEGAGGEVPPGWIVRIKSVCIEKNCVHGVITYLSDGQASWDQHAGTIGEDILKNFTVTVDWPRHALYLERNAGREKPEAFTQSGILNDFDDKEKDLKVVAVLRNSPGDKAGVRVGDRILLIDHRPPIATWATEDPAFLKPSGTVVSLTIQRGQLVQQVKIRLKHLL
jgi:aspartyl protease/PDZ domain-containing protein